MRFGHLVQGCICVHVLDTGHKHYVHFSPEILARGGGRGTGQNDYEANNGGGGSMHCWATQSAAIQFVARGSGGIPPENYCLRCILMHFQPKVSNVHYYISE